MKSKNKNLFLKIYIPFVIITIIALIVLQILGSKKRIGYLTDFNLEIDRTLELNNLTNINESFTIDGKLDEESIKNYLLTNENITNYVYHFRIRYYDKIFRNNDIYGVYVDLSNLPDYIKNSEMEEGGSPYGNFISDRKSIGTEKIDNINYTLKIKFKMIIYIIIINILIIFIYFCISKYRAIVKIFFNIISFISKKIYKCFIKAKKYIFNKINKKSKEYLLNYNGNIIKNFIINFLFSLLLTILLIFILKLFNLSDVQIYALSLVFITLCFYFISVKNITVIKKLYNTFIDDERGRILIYSIIVVFIISMINTFIELKEWNYYPFLKSWSEIAINRNIFPFIIEIILSIFLLYILISLSNNYLAIFLAIIAIILVVYGKLQIAIMDIYHYSVHFNSVFMVHNYYAYSNSTYTSLGHFALLMEPFFKVFGLNVKIYALLISILCGISALCVIITIFLVIKSSFFRILGILITFFIYFTMEYNYYAVAPLRIFFPSIMILYMAIIGNKKNIVLTIIGYCIVSLSILWNAETGLVCLASLFISNIYVYCYDLTFKDKKLYYNILLFAMFSICSLLLSYLILNICNVYFLGGEKQTIKDLLYPLIGEVSSLQEEIKIQKLFNYWFIVVLIFLTTFIYYIKNMKIFNDNNYIKLEYYTPSIIFCSICGLGVYSYAINRTAFFNSMIIMPMISIIIPFILYRLYILLNKKSELSKSAYNIILTIFIIGMFSSISVSVNNFTNFYNPVSNNFYNYMQTKNDEKNSITYTVTEFLKEYGYNGEASFGSVFTYGYANLGWTNSLIFPAMSIWGTPTYPFTNAVKTFLDKKPDIFFLDKTPYFNFIKDETLSNFYKYVENYYTNIPTKYEKYGLYLYSLK